MQARLHSVLSVSSVFSVPSVANTLTHPRARFLCPMSARLAMLYCAMQHLHIDPVQSTRHPAAF